MTKKASILSKNVEDLKELLNLSKSEATIFLSVLELGQTNIQDLVRKSGLKRTSVYSFIQSLKSKNLITDIVKGKRRLFSAVDPNALVEQQKTKLDLLNNLIPELLAIDNKKTNKPKVTYYEGIDGIKQVYMLMLQDKQTIYAWEDLDRMCEVLPKSFFRKYPEERSAKKIPFRSIVRKSEFAKKFVDENNERLSRDSRFIDSNELGTEINIFGSKIALFSLDKENPFAVLIEDVALSNTLKVIWSSLWSKL